MGLCIICVAKKLRSEFERKALNEPECKALHFDTKRGSIRCWNRTVILDFQGAFSARTYFSLLIKRFSARYIILINRISRLMKELTFPLAALVNLNLWMTSVRVSLTQLIVSLMPTQLWAPTPNGKKAGPCAAAGHLAVLPFVEWRRGLVNLCRGRQNISLLRLQHWLNSTV